MTIMAATKIFLSCLTTLILFNALFFITGYNTSIISYESILGVFLTLGGIAILISLIPTTSASGTIKWFMAIIIMTSIMYSITFTVLTYNLTVGIGLASNLTNMFSGDLNSLSFMPWLFFMVIGLIGLISGIMATSGGD